MSSVKTTTAKTELSLSNIDSAHFTKDDFDPSNDLKVSLRIKPQKVRFIRRMLLFTTKFSNTNCETSTAGRGIANTNAGGRVRLFNYSTYPGTLNNGCQMLIIFKLCYNVTLAIHTAGHVLIITSVATIHNSTPVNINYIALYGSLP